MNTQTVISLNGKSLKVPREFFDLSVKASFDSNPQSNLSTDEFTFVLDAYQEVIEWLNDGLNGGVGIFEGIPLQISANGGSGNVEVFKGIVDLQNETRIYPQLGQVEVNIRQDEGLNPINDLIEPLDYGYLKEIGVITSADYQDVDYTIVKIDTTAELIGIFIIFYSFSKELVDLPERVASIVATTTGIAASGVVLAQAAAALYAAIMAAITIAYLLLIAKLIIELSTNLFNIIIQPKRTHKCMSFKKLLEKACNYIGYGFNSSISELDKYHYLPSNPNYDDKDGTNFIKVIGSITEGIPNVRDYGYGVPEMFQLVRDIFNGRFSVEGNTIQFHSENSEYWIRESEWIKPDAKANQAGSSYRYNTEDLKGSYKISFQTDLSEEYTIENYRGTAYQILTDAKTIKVAKNRTLKGFKEVSIPLALGTRKDSLNGLEKLVSNLAGVIDRLTRLTRKPTNFKAQVKERVSLLKVSTNNHSTPKALYLNGSRMPGNSRDLLSAKYLWDNFHNYNSFLLNNYGKQRKIIEGERIPFGFNDFVKVLNNSYFKDRDGKLGKITELEWNMNKDYAVISYWQKEIYTKNLKEVYIEP